MKKTAAILFAACVMAQSAQAKPLSFLGVDTSHDGRRYEALFKNGMATTDLVMLYDCAALMRQSVGEIHRRMRYFFGDSSAVFHETMPSAVADAVKACMAHGPAPR